ncbi:MAG: hypothetical protein HQL32_10950 [Planctomycetes bacterium]|nr:hypothetical protein [Planctomycetota bacterium]
MNIARIAILTLGIILTTHPFAVATDDLACLVSIKSPYENFSAHLKAEMVKALNQAPSLAPLEQPLIGSYRDYVQLSLRYPVYALTGKVTLYVLIDGRRREERYLCLSHSSHQKDLNLHQQKVFIEKAVKQITEQVSIEYGYSQGQALKAGYYANQRNLSVDIPLQVQLVDSNKKQRSISPQSPETAEYNRRKSITLISEQRALRDEALEKQQRRDKVLEMSMEFKSHNMQGLQEKPESSPVSKATKPHLQKTQRPSKKRFHSLQRELELTWRAPARSQIYRELSTMYRDIGQQDQAYRYAKEATATYADQESKDLVRELEGPLANPVERFRIQNKKRDLKVAFKAIVEYDTNVIQEAVDSYTHFDKDDFSAHLGLSLDKKWALKFKQIENRSSYDLFSATFTNHGEFDLLTHRVGHDFHISRQSGDHFIYYSFGLGYNHFSRRSTTLLSGMDASASFSVYRRPAKLLLSGSFMHLNKSYSDQFYDSDIRSGHQNRVELSAQKVLLERHQFQAKIGFLEDVTSDASLSYNAYFLEGSWHYRPMNEWVTSLGPFSRFTHRDYEESERGRNLRKDDLECYGFQITKNAGKNINFQLDYRFYDNRSTRRFNTYLREQISLNYRILF